jgi:hypothetical protein
LPRNYSASFIELLKYGIETYSQLIEEVSEFDAKTKEISAKETKNRMKDYKKTSMLKGIVVFDEFLSKLGQTWKGKRLETSGKSKRQVVHSVFMFA